MAWKTLDDIDLAGKVVLTRVDINVPMEGGRVTDATRIEKIVPTVRDIQAKGGKVVLLAHFDRPKGKVVPEMSLSHVQGALAQALGAKVVFGADCVGAPAAEAIAAAGFGDVVLLENTRFLPGEEKNDPALVAQMAALGDVYVNDAFSAAHRAHASTEGLARALRGAEQQRGDRLAAGRDLDAALERRVGDLEALGGIGAGRHRRTRLERGQACEQLADLGVVGGEVAGLRDHPMPALADQVGARLVGAFDRQPVGGVAVEAEQRDGCDRHRAARRPDREASRHQQLHGEQQREDPDRPGDRRGRARDRGNRVARAGRCHLHTWARTRCWRARSPRATARRQPQIAASPASASR